MRWIDGPGDPDRDGFVEYERATDPRLGQPGLEKIRGRDLPCRRPRLAQGSVALAEVQGYVFAAKRAGRGLRAGASDGVSLPRGGRLEAEADAACRAV